ncbi:MAG: O-antigen ligase family protein [Chloroflexota bacterium]|nr:O-antigen ligase family protein [Chloroflexota bacterium]
MLVPDLTRSEKRSKSATYLIGAGLCASCALFFFQHRSPASLWLLVVAALLAWLCLDLAVALLPLTFPYYHDLLPLVAGGSRAFSLNELGICICVGAALLRFLLLPEEWQVTRVWVQNLLQQGRPMFLAALLLFLGTSLALLVSPDRPESLHAYRQQIIEPLLYFLLVLCYIRTRADVARICGSLIISVVIAACLGIAQGLFHITTGLLIVSTTTFRVDGPYPGPNSLAFLFDRTLPILLALLLPGVFRRPTSRGSAWRDPLCWGYLVALVPLVWALYWTDSRGAEVALLAVFLLLLIFEARHRLVVLVAAGVGAIGMGLFWSRVIHLFNVPGHGLLSERLLLWKAGWLMIRDSFWLGSGLNSFNTRYRPDEPRSYALKALNGQAFPADYNSNLLHPHNFLLDFWISSGLSGVLALVWLLWAFAAILVRTYRLCAGLRQGNVLQRLLIGIAGSMLAGLIHGLVDNFYFAPDLAMIFWLFMGVALVVQNIARREQDAGTRDSSAQQQV